MLWELFKTLQQVKDSEWTMVSMSNKKKRGWRGVDVLRLVLTPWIHRRIEDSFVRLDELIDDAYPYSHLHHDRRKKQQRQRNDVDIHPSSPIIWARHFEQQKRDRQVFRSNYQILNN